MSADNSYGTKEHQGGNREHLLARDAVAGMELSRLSPPPPTMHWAPAWLKPGQLSHFALPGCFSCSSLAGHEELPACIQPPSISH